MNTEEMRLLNTSDASLSIVAISCNLKYVIIAYNKCVSLFPAYVGSYE
jgi:hypothetical protein